MISRQESEHIESNNVEECKQMNDLAEESQLSAEDAEFESLMQKSMKIEQNRKKILEGNALISKQELNELLSLCTIRLTYVNQHQSIAMEVLHKIALQLDRIQDVPSSSVELLVAAKNSQKLLDDFHAHYSLILQLVLTPDQTLSSLLVRKEYKSIKSLYTGVSETPKLNPMIIEKCLNYVINTLFEQLYTILEGVLRSNKKPEIQNLTVDLEILLSKLTTLLEYLPSMVAYEGVDILALPNNHERWQALNPFIKIKEVGQKKSLEKEFRMLDRCINTVSAVVSRSSIENSLVMKNIAYASGAIFYWFNPKQATRTAGLGISRPKQEQILTLWNLSETKLVKHALSFRLPAIATNKKLYIKPMFPKLTLERLNAELAGEAVPMIDNKHLLTMLGSFSSRSAMLKEVQTKSRDRIQVRLLYHKKLKFEAKSQGEFNTVEVDEDEDTSLAASQLLSKRRASQATPTLMSDVSPSKKPIARSYSYGKTSKNPGALRKFITNNLSFLLSKSHSHTENELEEIIIHIHGGGFVATSSGTHQNYTRKWANKLKHPVFSIDYKLAPEYPFCEALDDCWQVYNWIITFSEHILGIKPKKVFLAGDSAGGNLMIALTIKAINSGVRVPDGLLAAYPAVNLNTKKFTPSFLYSIDDYILSYSSLKLCVKAYVPDSCDPATNYYISPVVTPDEILKKLPPIRIMVGEKDSLHDDCVRLLERLVCLGKDAKLWEYKYLPHGFLSYDQLSCHKHLIEDSVHLLKELSMLSDSK